MSDDFDRDYDDERDDDNYRSGNYNEDDLQVDLIINENKINCVLKKEVLATIPLDSITKLLNEKYKKQLSKEELVEVIKNYTGSIQIDAEVSVTLSSPYLYGQDADGKRGTLRQDYNDVDEDSIEINKLNLFIIDEDGYELGGNDYSIDLIPFLLKEKDPIIAYIAEQVDNDPNSYVD